MPVSPPNIQFATGQPKGPRQKSVYMPVMCVRRFRCHEPIDRPLAGSFKEANPLPERAVGPVKIHVEPEREVREVLPVA